jgi:hypothetical protein
MKLAIGCLIWMMTFEDHRMLPYRFDIIWMVVTSGVALSKRNISKRVDQLGEQHNR